MRREAKGVLKKGIGADMSPYLILDKYHRYREPSAWNISLQSLSQWQACYHHHDPVPKFAIRGDGQHSSRGDRF